MPKRKGQSSSAASECVRQTVKMQKFVLNEELELVIPQPAKSQEARGRICSRCSHVMHRSELAQHEKKCVVCMALRSPNDLALTRIEVNNAVYGAAYKVKMGNKEVGVMYIMSPVGYFTGAKIVHLAAEMAEAAMRKEISTCRPNHVGFIFGWGRTQHGDLFRGFEKFKQQFTTIMSSALDVDILSRANQFEPCDVQHPNFLQVSSFLSIAYVPVSSNHHPEGHGPPWAVATRLHVPSCRETCSICGSGRCYQCPWCCLHYDNDLSITHLSLQQPVRTPARFRAWSCIADEAYPLTSAFSVLFNASVGAGA